MRGVTSELRRVITPLLQPRSGIEYSDKSISGEHGSQLFAQDRCGPGVRPRPVRLSEMDVAVPESGQHGRAGAVEQGGALWNGQLRAAAHGRDRARSYQDDPVLDRRDNRTRLHRPADQRYEFAVGPVFPIPTTGGACQRENEQTDMERRILVGGGQHAWLPEM